MKFYDDPKELMADFLAVLELGASCGVPSNRLVGEAMTFFHRLQRGFALECVDDYWYVVDSDRRAQRKFLEKRRKLGLCVKCGKPVKRPGDSMCPKCAERMRRYNALRQMTPEQLAGAIAPES